MKKIVVSTALLSCAILAGCASNAGNVLATSSTGPAPTVQAKTQTCQPVSEAEIAALFDRWNQSLKTEDAQKVVSNYAAQSILLPTVSNKPRLTAAEKLDYFKHFLENQPTGTINMRVVQIGCNTAFDAGLYSFSFAKTGTQVHGRYSFTYAWNGEQWLITSHHSSLMPEKQ